MQSKVYIAGSYSRRTEFQAYAAQLDAAGYWITCRWLSGSHDGLDDGTNAIEAKSSWALEDIEDVAAADILVCFTEPEGTRRGRGRGGRHVEFGIAFGLNIAFEALADHPKLIRLVVIGPRENVFYCCSEVEQFDTWEAFLRSLGVELLLPVAVKQ